MGFSTIQLHVYLIARVQVEDDTVAGVVVVLVSILSDGAGSDLQTQQLYSL